jgi:hypothetical protein
LKNHINSRGYTHCCDDFAQKNQSTQIPHNNINNSKTSLKKLILQFLKIMWSYRATSQLQHGQHKWHTNTQIENVSKQCHTIVLGCEGKISNIQHHNCSTCLNFYKFISDQKDNMQNKQTCGIHMSRCEDYYLPCLGELSMVNQI